MEEFLQQKNYLMNFPLDSEEQKLLEFLEKTLRDIINYQKEIKREDGDQFIEEMLSLEMKKMFQLKKHLEVKYLSKFNPTIAFLV